MHQCVCAWWWERRDRARVPSPVHTSSTHNAVSTTAFRCALTHAATARNPSACLIARYTYTAREESVLRATKERAQDRERYTRQVSPRQMTLLHR